MIGTIKTVKLFRRQIKTAHYLVLTFSFVVVFCLFDCFRQMFIFEYVFLN